MCNSIFTLSEENVSGDSRVLWVFFEVAKRLFWAFSEESSGLWPLKQYQTSIVRDRELSNGYSDCCLRKHHYC